MLRLQLACLLAFSIGWHTGSKANPLDLAYDQLWSAYPIHRNIDGGLSLMTGIPTLLGSFAVFSDNGSDANGKQRGFDEVLVGIGGLTLGTLSVLDGIVTAFGRSSAELLVPHYQNFPRTGKPRQYGGAQNRQDYGKTTLQRLARSSKQARYVRATRDLYTSMLYLYLYLRSGSFDPVERKVARERYRALLIPGAFIGLVSVYRFIFTSPEERALQTSRRQFPSASIIELYATLTAGAPSLGLALSW